jgi:hypothetical protein
MRLHQNQFSFTLGSSSVQIHENWDNRNMRQFCLEAYSVKVRNKGKVQEADLNFSLFDGSKSLFTVVEKILDDRKDELFDSPSTQKCWRLEKVVKSNNALKCLIRSGEYGTSHQLLDKKDGTLKYNQLTSDVPMQPFYIHILLPDDCKCGVMLFQRTGQSGVKTCATEMIMEGFSKTHPNHVILVEPLMPAEALETLMKKSTLTAVKFSRQIIPTDFAEKFNGTRIEQEGEMEIVIRPKGKGLLGTQSLIDLLKGKKQLSDLLTIHDFIPDNLKAEIVFSGKKRTIDFGNTQKFKASFDISEDIELASDGYPKFDSIDTVATGIAQDLLKKLEVS